MVKESGDLEEEKKEFRSAQSRARYTPMVYQLYQHVDCLDSHNHWLNAQIIAVKPPKVKVHFSGWDSKYDAWYDIMSPRIIKQWKQNSNFYLNNRVDVLDTEGKWLEARIVDVVEEQIKVHYKNYSDKWDEWLNKNSRRIAPIGKYSEAFGQAKCQRETVAKYEQKLRAIRAASKSSLSEDNLANEEEEERIQKLIEQIQAQEAKFKRLLAMKNLKIVPTQGDGNCLFRGVADQIYGDQTFHNLVRQRCMDYIMIERDFFKEFVVGGESNFSAYVEAKRTDGVWGDDLEIEAISEIYNRPIQIYAYSADPMRTFHEADPNIPIPPIRLSYHGQAHYNSIVPFNESDRCIVKDKAPGEIEDTAIRISRIRNAKRRLQEREKELADKEKGEKMEEEEVKEEQGSISKNELQQSAQQIEKSRQVFEQQGIRDMQAVLAESLQDAKKSEKGESQQQLIEQVEEAIKESLKETNPLYGQYFEAEEQQLENVLQKSKKDAEKEALEQAIKESLKGALGQEEFEMDPSIKEVMRHGISLQRAMEAYSVMGGNAELMLQYLYGFFG